MHKFDASYYETAATVIPVFFLALTLQGRTYEDLMTRWRSSATQTPTELWPQIRFMLSAFVAIIVALAVFFGIYGEYLALRAVYTGKATSAIRQSVFVASIGLLAVVAAAPLYSFLTAYFGTLAANFREAIRKRRRYKDGPETDPKGS